MFKTKKAIALIVLLAMLCSTAIADQIGWILCNPKSTVNVHFSAGKGNDVIARAECGDELILDGKRKGEWVHIVNCWCDHDGWVYEGYISTSPVTVGERYMTTTVNKLKVRKYVNGKVLKRIKKGKELTVYAWSDGWTVTNVGYVKMKYLSER